MCLQRSCTGIPVRCAHLPEAAAFMGRNSVTMKKCHAMLNKKWWKKAKNTDSSSRRNEEKIRRPKTEFRRIPKIRFRLTRRITFQGQFLGTRIFDNVEKIT